MHERIRLTLLFNCEMEKGARGWISIKSVNSRKVANSGYTAQRTYETQNGQLNWIRAQETQAVHYSINFPTDNCSKKWNANEIFFSFNTNFLFIQEKDEVTHNM